MSDSEVAATPPAELRAAAATQQAEQQRLQQLYASVDDGLDAQQYERGVANKGKAVSWARPEELEKGLAGDLTGVCSVCPGAHFGAKDEHLAAIGRALGPRLLRFTMGSSDTGEGCYVTPAGVTQLVQDCPNLTVLKLESAIQVDNATFHRILERCPELRLLTVTGNDRIRGRLKGRQALKPLMDGALPKLKSLDITDQGESFEAVEKLVKLRGRFLAVSAGETDGDGMASSMVRSMMGQSFGDNLYGNRRGQRQLQFGGY